MPPFTRVSPPQTIGLLARIRLCLAIVMGGLILSGLIGFFRIRWTGWLLLLLARSAHLGVGSALFNWILRVHQALLAAAATSPFLTYSSDWLALAYLLLALVFFGPFRQPLRNRWVITFGLLCCAAVVLLALVAGPIRGIPVFWRLINCSFAVLCALPLLLCRHYLSLLDHLEVTERQRLRGVRLRRHHRRGGRPRVRD